MDDHLHWEAPQEPSSTAHNVGYTDGPPYPDMDGLNYLGEEDPLFNMDGLGHSELYNNAPYDIQQDAWLPSWVPFNQLSDPASSQLLDTNLAIPPPEPIPDDPSADPDLFNPPVQQRPLTDVSQWLDGAYCPPVPCTYCRRHRLQCLIIRTTAANPNPVTSCSSCVALFRECSLALGEKRQPSRFETLSPVLGNLHGLREINEDASVGAGDADRPGSPDPEGGSNCNAGSKQFVRKGARVLRAWLLEHQSHPYPTDEQKSQLVLETGFSRQRISTWFANARRRQKQKHQEQQNPIAPSPARIYRAGSPMPSSPWASMTPFERWQASPPEDDPLPESTIRNAIASTTTPGSDSEPQHLSSSQTDSFFPPFDMDLDLELGGTALDSPFLNLDPETSSHLDPDSSASGFGSRRSDISSDSVSSAWSLQSDGGVPLPGPSHLRRGRSSSRVLRRRHSSRRSSNTQDETLALTNKNALIYECTFCPQSFKKKNDWSRHESSVHLTLDSWICTPNLSELFPFPGPTSTPPLSHEQAHDQEQRTERECPFCTHPSPSQAHYTDHDFHACAAKPLAERSFPRKDHLVQHLRKFHSCSKSPVPDLSAWRVSRRGCTQSPAHKSPGENPRQGAGVGQNQVRSRCGFCSQTLESWTERVDHLAGHFRQGCRMGEWVGDWGLEEEVMAGLRRAVDPGLR